MLTFDEVAAISVRLRVISDTWSDLWLFQYYLPSGISRLIRLRYTDISSNYLILQRVGKFKERRLIIPVPVAKIIYRRALAYPDDIFIFQSHSNRVKAVRAPVTVIAFNMALKKAAAGVTDKVISSKSARLE